jgi:Domain of unknown function (DUF4932)
MDEIPFDSISTNNIEEVYEYSSGIKISIDPRIEFIAIVFSMTHWGTMIDDMLRDQNPNYKDYTYFHEIENKFYPFRNHPAIILADSLVVSQDFIWNAIPEYILFHDNPPELKQIRQYNKKIIDRAGSADNLKSLSRELHDFAIQSDFAEFYLSHLNFYKGLIKGIANNFSAGKSIQSVEQFFGWKLKSYHIILAPCMHPMGGYGMQISQDDNYHGIFLQRVAGIQDNKPYFGDAHSIYNLALHEFGHSFVNPTTEKYADQINALKPIYKEVEDSLKHNVNHNWLIKFDEQLLESFSVYTDQVAGDSLNAEKSITFLENTEGLYLTRQVAELYHYYMKHRDKYPTFDLFYPEIINAYYQNVDAIKKKYNLLE